MSDLAKLVKPLGTRELSWVDAQSYSPWFYAQTEVGEYRWGWCVRKEGAYATRNAEPIETGTFANGQEAKIAAQADFDKRRQEQHTARILAALDPEALARWRDEAVQAEREACAKGRVKAPDAAPSGHNYGTYYLGYKAGAKALRSSIRARKGDTT